MKIIYGVSSVGLGHARRSVEIADRLEALGHKIDWVASEPTSTFLRSKRKHLLPVSSELASLSEAMERQVKDGRLNDISKVARISSTLAKANYFKIRPFLEMYDVLIQDEFAETMFSFMWEKRTALPRKKIVVTDYLRLETLSRSPVSRTVTWYANKMLKKAYQNSGLRIFADDLDFIPGDTPFNVVGPITGKVPKESREELRAKLLSVKSKVIIVICVGGTSTGKHLVDIIYSRRDAVLSEIKGAALIFMLGSRIDRSQYPEDNETIQFVQFTPDSVSFFKAADVVVTQAGASTLNEVASVGTPCVTVPIEGHWEQEENSIRFARKYGFQRITNQELSEKSILTAIRNAMKSRYEPLQSSGADRAAHLIDDYLHS